MQDRTKFVAVELFCVVSKTIAQKEIQLDPYYGRQTCSLGILVSGNVRSMRTFAGFRGKKASNDRVVSHSAAVPYRLHRLSLFALLFVCNKSARSSDVGFRHRRRSSVNFGGKTFLPENICMKN